MYMAEYYFHKQFFEEKKNSSNGLFRPNWPMLSLGLGLGPLCGKQCLGMGIFRVSEPFNDLKFIKPNHVFS